MTLPASGTITWSQICTEFSLNPVTAVWPTNFYGLGGAPGSGNLSFADFYGRSAGGTYTPVPGTYSYADNGTTTGGSGSGVTVTSVAGSVAWTWSATGSASLSGSISSGSSAASIAFNLPAAAGSGTRTAAVTLTQGGNSWTLNLTSHGLGDPGGGTCVACDTPVLMADGTEKLAGQLQAGDVVRTRHELTGEWGRYEITNVELVPDTVYRLRGFPDATKRHRFGYELFGIRWFRAGWFGRKARDTMVAKITVMGAHTYMARSPEPGSKWRLCHNLKP
jgi:hypothetical protein